ncbi:hypothetical protein CIL05_01190 [Virgibacillus profundi]|uniref:Peptidase S8 n=1 Tax=Virgibacillus profundi TaxID=2024555 RepID=A0A2A2IIZ6_9BACI|nr:cell wall-binding repeat-containing protein [Virgibacillus profundi]PAV31296.1 hypothetical protein CIL05_01190 [Virgibacillus profundi]PXY55481.1 hypothetical protein CIT14_01195 [Virgibacillus profundi]
MKSKSNYIHKWLYIGLALLMAVSMVIPQTAYARGTNSEGQNPQDTIPKALATAFGQEHKVTFLIKFNDKPAVGNALNKASEKINQNTLNAEEVQLQRHIAVLNELKSTSEGSQESVLEYLRKEAESGNAEDIRSFHIVNGIAVTATEEVAKKVLDFNEVEKVLPNRVRHLTETKNEESNSVHNNIETNIEQVGAPEVWGQNIDGSGVIIASIDSGVDWDHPALKGKYRGYNSETGEVDHSFNWFDAVNGKTVPYDIHGHGTHVTGTMIGSEPDGSNQIGVAPGAKWIAVNAFNTSGTATDADLLKAAEWILAPTDEHGNERPDMAPDIVNNSWSGGKGKDEWYRDVVKNWIAAGIFPEFSAGNNLGSKPTVPGSVEAPANYPESFATGAVNSENKLTSFSLLGPSPYNEIKPDVVAPGESIRSSVPGGEYGSKSGTSMAGPAVSGVVALLKQAGPSLTVKQMKHILRETATPLTDETYPESPNNGYGYGLVNAPAALNATISMENSNVKRISGSMRYDTAIEISRQGWNSSDTVILARGDNFADSLAGVPLAHKLNAPILLTTNNMIFDRTMREIKRLRADKVIILGGTGAISNKVQEQLIKSGIKVTRYSGETRFETASEIAKQVSSGEAATAVVVNGMNFPDALSVASYAAREGIPILLTYKNSLPQSTIDTLNTLGTKDTIVVGGTKVVSDKIKGLLPHAIRLRGANRYATNMEVAKYFGVETKHMYIATGGHYADALTGAVLATKNDSGILLVGKLAGEEKEIPKVVSDYILENKFNRLTIFGGTEAVTKKSFAELEQLIQ